MSALSTPLCDLLGVRYPIVQTGMGWVSGPALTSATANAGGLGILASATMTYDELEAAIVKTETLTDKPFGVNLITMHPNLNDLIAICAKHRVSHVVLAGGLSHERDVSLRSGRRVAQALRDRGHQVIESDVNAALADLLATTADPVEQALRRLLPAAEAAFRHALRREPGNTQALADLAERKPHLIRAVKPPPKVPTRPTTGQGAALGTPAGDMDAKERAAAAMRQFSTTK